MKHSCKVLYLSVSFNVLSRYKMSILNIIFWRSIWFKRVESYLMDWYATGVVSSTFSYGWTNQETTTIFYLCSFTLFIIKTNYVLIIKASDANYCIIHYVLLLYYILYIIKTNYVLIIKASDANYCIIPQELEILSIKQRKRVNNEKYPPPVYKTRGPWWPWNRSPVLFFHFSYISPAIWRT